MSSSKTLKPIALTLGATFVTSLAATGIANAADNPFAQAELSSGYMVADTHMEGKCGAGKMEKSKEGKCGSGKMEGKMKEGKCGEGKMEGKAKEGKCGAGKTEGKMKEGKCGEGKCGAGMKKK